MTVIKTAISIQELLYEQAETLAKKMNISRSHLFGMAVEDFIQRYQNQALLEEINQAYTDEPDPREQLRLDQMRKGHRKIVEGNGDPTGRPLLDRARATNRLRAAGIATPMWSFKTTYSTRAGLIRCWYAH